MRPCVADRADLALNSTNAEAPRNDDSVHVSELFFCAFLGLAQVRGDPLHSGARIISKSTSANSLCHAEISVGKIDVLAHQSHGQFVLRLVDFPKQRVPLFPVNIAERQI